MCPRTLYIEVWFVDPTDLVTYSQSFFLTLVSSTDRMCWLEGPAMADQPSPPPGPMARAITEAKWNFCGRKTLGSSLQSRLPSSRLLWYHSSTCPSPCPCLSLPPQVSWVVLTLDVRIEEGQMAEECKGMQESLNFRIGSHLEVIFSIFWAESFIHHLFIR